MHLIIDNAHLDERPDLHERFEANDAHWHDQDEAEAREWSLLFFVGGACFAAGCLFTTTAAWVISWFL